MMIYRMNVAEDDLNELQYAHHKLKREYWASLDRVKMLEEEVVLLRT